MIKIGSFFEEHVEKIVLAVFGILCIWLLITRVLLSPNQVVYNNEKYSPSAVDDRVYEDAELLRQKLSSEQLASALERGRQLDLDTEATNILKEICS